MNLLQKLLYPLFFLIVFFTAGFLLVNNNPSPKNVVPAEIKSVIIAGQTLKVKLALSEMEKSRGLSGSNNLKNDESMLFIFAKPGIYYFWMKDMKFPLDIIWITEDMKVAYIKKNARPESYPETYGSEQNAKYVLEINAGFSDKNNLKEGDRVIFGY